MSKLQAAIIQGVYKIVLSTVKTDRETLFDIKFRCENTDDFFTDEIDEVYRNLTNDDVEEAIDRIFVSVICIQEIISTYYADIWNFAPGYKPPKISFIDTEDIPEEVGVKLAADLMKLVNNGEE